MAKFDSSAFLASTYLNSKKQAEKGNKAPAKKATKKATKKVTKQTVKKAE